ncbi:hypothetical protein KAU33_09260 [Candidatus Dependentiae bacterium]|nr:hypothetical protein [Candidatus Dependentiae bacterium]
MNKNTQSTPETRTFDKNDRIEVTELFRKENLIKGATIKGTVISSDPDYTEMIIDNGLYSHIRTRHLQKIEPTIIEGSVED